MVGKKVTNNSDREWTSFEIVQHLIKFPDTSDDTIFMMYENLLGDDTLEKDMEDYWDMKIPESLIDQEEFETIKNRIKQRLEQIRKLDHTKKDADDIAKWALTNAGDE